MSANKLEFAQRLEKLLGYVYPREHIGDVLRQIFRLVAKWQYGKHPNPHWVDGNTVYLITYGDSLHHADEKPLATLNQFARNHFDEIITDIHILPMYPYSSDDGFSVIDYRLIDEHLGGWGDLKTLSKKFNLMFDCVINHVSRSSDWVRGFMHDDPNYAGYLIAANPALDYSRVVRPRSSRLLTPMTKANGEMVYLWTTFSDDQIDINFHNPQVLLESIDILLQYAASGGQSIRLDAIGYIWKEPGTRCIHLPQAHNIIKVWRTVLDYVIPGTRLITETNVPHHENISYFGHGDEAHMVYQFPLPPLTLHAFLRQDTTVLTKWAHGLSAEARYPETTFFNFLASHDGIGLRPTETFLDDSERQFMAQEVIRKEGRVSHKDNGDGTFSPYELNINYLSALTEKQDSNGLKAKKFIAAQSLLLSFVGVPALYYHSLLGSENDVDGMHQSGINRRINRQKLDVEKVEAELANPESLRAKVYSGLRHLITLRRAHPAFAPSSGQRVLDLGKSLFGLERYDPKNEDRISCVINVTDHKVGLALDEQGHELISDTPFTGKMTLTPWQVVWIQH